MTAEPQPTSVNPAAARSPAAHYLLDPVVFGTLCGLFSATVYTAANVFLRSVSHCDPIWVSAVKALPTALFMAPWLVWNRRRGIGTFPSWPIFAAIAAGGLLGQVGGNVSFQWALGQIGVALTVPLTLGGMIVAASLLGRFALHEPIPVRSAVAIIILLAAICVLSLGAKEARQSVAAVAGNPWQLAAGVGAACFSGLAYSVLNVVIRYAVQRGASLPAMLFTVSIVGMLSLGSLSLGQIGLAGMGATTSVDLGMMLLGGVCNAVAFVALTKSLQLTSVVYVNALNATQATLAAAAGIVFFHEAASQSLVLGVGLTIAGLLFMRQRKKSPQDTIDRA